MSLVPPALIKFSLAVVVCVFSVSAFAQEKPAEDIPEVLDFYERKAELTRFEISPFFGDFFGDHLHHSFLFGGQANYRITPRFSIGAEFFWTNVGYDPASAVGQAITNDNLYSMQGVLTINAPAAQLGKKGVIEMDFFTTLGGGVLHLDGRARGDGFIGVGTKVFSRLAPWLAFRIEVRNFFTTMPHPNGSKFSADVVMTYGPTFLLPPKFL